MSTNLEQSSQMSSPDLVSDADYVQLCRLVIEVAWRIDSGRSDTLGELFTEDAEISLGAPLRGRQAIHEWGRQVVENPPWHSIGHVCGNMRFVTDGANAAEGTTVVTVFMDEDGAQTSAPSSVGEDHQRFVRTDDGWRIAFGTHVHLFSRGDSGRHPVDS